MATATTPVKVELLGENNSGDILTFTCADGTGITKYQPMTISDPRTVAYSTANVATAYVWAGFASEEKTASDGQTRIGVFANGIFEVQCSGAVTLGAPMKHVGNGYFAQANVNDFASGVIAGYALETGSDLEVINMRSFR